MRKIPTVFQRDMSGENRRKLCFDAVVPDAAWVTAGEGVAKRKWDGTCVMIHDGNYFKRYDAKHGKTPPPGFIPAQDPDPETGHWPGWIEVGSGPDDKWHWEAMQNTSLELTQVTGPRTFELCGPKLQANPERFETHVLLAHDLAEEYPDCPRTFEGLREWFKGKDIEGVVFHHPDGRMAKVKKRDFGLDRKD